jgi:hypothetical protein
MRRYPLCWGCEEEVDTDPIYEAVCGHDRCPSSVWHGLCLMKWREKREILDRAIERFVREHPDLFGGDR